MLLFSHFFYFSIYVSSLFSIYLFEDEIANRFLFIKMGQINLTSLL